MNKNWIVRKNRSKLILFFNGWGMNECAINHLSSYEYDVVEFNDYNEFDANDYLNFREYDSLYLVAWSLGVFVASRLISESHLKIKKSIAINGTLNPVSDTEGIPTSTFEGTLKGWNEKNRERFLLRTIGNRKLYNSNLLKFGSRTIENQKVELIKIYESIKTSSHDVVEFDRSIIGRRDAIFSYDNQIRYWKDKASVLEIDMPHYPFLQLLNWDKIIQI